MFRGISHMYLQKHQIPQLQTTRHSLAYSLQLQDTPKHFEGGINAQRDTKPHITQALENPVRKSRQFIPLPTTCHPSYNVTSYRLNMPLGNVMCYKNDSDLLNSVCVKVWLIIRYTNVFRTILMTKITQTHEI